MRVEIFHDALGFLVRCTVTVIVMACLVSHDLDTLLHQPVEALLQRGVHGRNGCRKPFRVETVVVYSHFPVFGEPVLFAFSNVFVRSLKL